MYLPEIRKDPVTDRWVIIATERAKRPSEFKMPPEEKRGGPCVFCEGQEGKTPPEVLAYGDPNRERDTPGWRVRAFPNKFPALMPETEREMVGEGIYTAMAGKGAHEIVVETPQHDKSLEDLEPGEVFEVLKAWRERHLELSKDPDHRYVLIFKNSGAAAGASLEHSHCQIIATPLVPVRIREEIEGASEHFARHGRCAYCEMLEKEAHEGVRQVAESEHFYAFSPYASCFPFETWVVPKKHSPDFGTVTEDELHDMSRILLKTLGALAEILDHPPYNLVLHTAPCNEGEYPPYHWHLEIVPRLTKIAGFEWGTGYYINPTPPEAAASALREEIERADGQPATGQTRRPRNSGPVIH